MFKKIREFFTFKRKYVQHVIHNERYNVTFVNNDGVALSTIEMSDAEVKELRKRTIGGGNPFWISPKKSEIFLIGTHITQIYIEKKRHRPGPRSHVDMGEDFKPVDVMNK